MGEVAGLDPSVGKVYQVQSCGLRLWRLKRPLTWWGDVIGLNRIEVLGCDVEHLGQRAGSDSARNW